MRNLELLPHLPEVLGHSWIRELTSMSINSSCPIDFAKTPFHRRKLEAHVLRFSVGESRNRSLIDRPCRGEAKIRSRFGDVKGKHIRSVVVRHRARSALVDSHRMSRKPALFF